jgi:hypothetical protein
MREESANTECGAPTRTTAPSKQEVRTPDVQDWKPGLKLSGTTGPTSANRSAKAEARLPSEEGSTENHKLEYSRWHKPYGELCEALLKTDRETLVELSGTAEMAVFERLLELAGAEDAADERQHIGRAIDVILALKAMTTREGSSSPRAMQKTGSSARRYRLVLHHNGKIEYCRFA